MIIIDTNIISELMKVSPSLNVVKWLDQQDILQLFVTTITLAEISYGLHTQPNGKRRQFLEDAFNQTISEAFQHRILSFDHTAAECYGKLMAKRKKLGRPLTVLDGQIAAITLAHDAMLATRNVRDFADSGIEVVNPF